MERLHYLLGRPSAFYQSCGMILSDDNDRGTESDGSPFSDYCAYCYRNGAFTEDVSIEKYNTYIAAKKSKHVVIGAIIRAMYSRPVASISMLSEMTGIAIASIYSAVNILVHNGILAEITGGRRNRHFMLIGYMRIFTEND